MYLKWRLQLTRSYSLALVASMALAVLAACSSGDAATAKTAPGDTPTGARLFLTNGCSTCHGQDAIGSDVAPALPGHTEDQVVRQVRSPVGRMPAYSQSQISDAELDLIADYIVSLGGGGEHQEPVSLGDDEVIAMHHWMALDAIQADNLTEASHHLDHVIEMIHESAHVSVMEEIEQAVTSGELHDAEHLLEGHLAGSFEPDLGLGTLHGRLVVAALATGETDDAKHHLEHMLANPDDTGLSDVAEAAIEKIDAGEAEEAEHLIEDALEEASHAHSH